MIDKIASVLGASITALAGILCLVWWSAYNPVRDFQLHIPGMDGKPLQDTTLAETAEIGAFFEAFQHDPVLLPGAWPGFRGAARDNISSDRIALADQWDEHTPPVLWSINLGEGHAAPAVLNGRVYILDYDERKKQDVLRCFALADGRELWRRGYRVNIKRNHGISRSVPAVTARYAVTIGPQGHVMCVDAVTGDLKWGIDMVKEYGSRIPQWYTAQCPLIDGGTAVLAPAGTMLLIGVDLETGAVRWQTPNPREWQMSHASIMPMILGGRKMYVYTALGGVAGISAEQEDAGTLLWENREWNNSVIAPSPVVFPDGRIFLTAGYGAGSMLLKVTYSRNVYTTQVVYRHNPREGLACEQQTPVLFDGYLYGILPKDGGINRTQFICYDPEGKLVWASGKTHQFGLGPYLLADGKFFILNDDGVLTMIKARSDGYEELGSKKILPGRDAWGPPALAEGRMLLRDSTELVCIDLRSKQDEEQ